MTLRRNIANLEKKYVDLEKKFNFLSQSYKSMLKRMTNTEICIGLMRSRYDTYPPHTGGEGTWNQVGTCQEHCKDWTILPDMFPAGTFHTHSECNAAVHLEYSHQEHLIHIWNVILTCS